MPSIKLVDEIRRVYEPKPIVVDGTIRLLEKANKHKEKEIHNLGE